MWAVLEGELELSVWGYYGTLTWRSPLSLRAGSLLVEEEDWLVSSRREFPEPADGPDKGRLSLAG